MDNLRYFLANVFFFKELSSLRPIFQVGHLFCFVVVFQFLVLSPLYILELILTDVQLAKTLSHSMASSSPGCLFLFSFSKSHLSAAGLIFSLSEAPLLYVCGFCFWPYHTWVLLGKKPFVHCKDLSL